MSTPKNRKGFTEEWLIIQKSTIYKAIGAVVMAIVLIGGGYALKIYFENKIKERTFDNKAARFLRIDGTVTVKHRGEKAYIQATYDTGLEEGDTIQTGSNSTALLEYIDKTKYIIKPDSTLIITENSRKDNRIVNDLQNGGIKVNTNPESGAHYVKTPDVKVRVEKDSGADVANTGNKTTVVVGSGLATLLFGDDKEQTLTQDQVVDVNKDKSITTRKLPPPPELTKPESARELLLDRGQQVEFIWKPIADADSYNLTIATSPTFPEQAIKLRAKDIKETRFKWSNPSGGQIFWQVQSVTKDGIEGKGNEPAASLKIQLKGTTLPLVITKMKKVAEGLWTIEGDTTVGATIRVNNGKSNEVDGKGHFNLDIAVEAKQKEIVIEALDSGGNKGRVVKPLAPPSPY